MTRRVLLVEDEPNYRQIVRLMLDGLDVELLEAGDGVEALARLEVDDVDLVITDLNMPRLGGRELLGELKQRRPELPVVVITAYGSVDSAVDAIRAGAIDYLVKPFDEARLRLTLDRALSVSALLAENRRLRDDALGRWDFSQILGASPALVAALRAAGRVAQTDAAVLVTGESGTGKELVARAVHFNSRRARGPFVALNCAALPETLLEAELFGAEAGAYTGATKRRRGRVELARGGTLFLDEIGDMPLALQAKLLRLLQEKTYTPLGGEKELTADIRFVFATHRDLTAHVAAGAFRQDLFYRVTGLPVLLPPLRERGDDVLLLAEAFVARAAEAMGRRAPTLTDDARAALRAHGWPGNVRELANVIERAVILAEGPVGAGDLAIDAARARPPSASGSMPAVTTPGVVILPEAGLSLDAVERDLIRQAMERAKGNKSRAATLLGLTRATLRYRLEKMGVAAPDDGDD